MIKETLKMIAALAFFLIAGCDLTDNEKATKIGPFKATYYSGLKSEPVFAESVELPSMKYSYNHFHEIDAKEFRAEWDGSIEVYKNEQPVNISFDVSWAEVSLYIDDRLVESWYKSNKTIPVSLTKGTHSIKIKYKNNWHTVGFNTSFSSYPDLNIENAHGILKSIISDDTKVIYIGAYESSDTYNRISVSMPKSKDSILLIISSNNSVNWVLDSEMLSDVSGIIVSSKNGQSTIKNIDEKVPVYSMKGIENEYKSFSRAKRDVMKITGKEPSYVFGEYSMASVVIPRI